MQTQGKLIVIDGTDGSGKATQTRLLVERLNQEGFEVETIAFPQYGKKSCGLVEEYLEGKYGGAEEIGPYRASIFYAVDRYDASFQIHAWLAEGKIVIADRYVGSNMGHQGGKISDPEERARYYEWNHQLEHGIFSLPKPDINFVLFVPVEISIKLAEHRNATEGNKHTLKKDIHEADHHHLSSAAQAYLDLTERFDTFERIDCVDENALLPPQTIHEKIWNRLFTLLEA